MRIREFWIYLILLLVLLGCTNGQSTPTAVSPATSIIAFTQAAPKMFPTGTPTFVSKPAGPLSAAVKPTSIPTQTLNPLSAVTATTQTKKQFLGINIGPLLAHSNFATAVNEEDLKALITRIAPYTDTILTNSCSDGMDKAGAIAHQLGLSIFAGAKLGKDSVSNDKEMACLIAMAQRGDLDLAVIGNETITRGDLTEKQLVAYIEQFRSAVSLGIPVTSVESLTKIYDLFDLIAEVTVVAVNAYPSKENISIDQAAAWTIKQYVTLDHYVYSITPNHMGKDVIIAGTGWPSCGSNGSLANEASYFAHFSVLAQMYGRPAFWSEADDEAGTCWGLWDKQGNLKQGMKEAFSGVISGELKPEIEITFLPRIGSDSGFYCSNCLAGYVLNVKPQDYRVAVYIFVPNAGGWWIKESFEYPLTKIEDNGVWICPIATGGDDTSATKVAVFLVPKDYTPPLAAGWSELPKELTDKALDSSFVTRTK